MSYMHDELALVIGPAATERLVATYGGCCVFPPSGVPVGARWERVQAVIGMDAAAALVARYRGTRLYVPLNVEARRKWQEQEVERLVAEGLPDEEIAERVAVMVRPTANWVALVRRRLARSEKCLG